MTLVRGLTGVVLCAALAFGCEKDDSKNKEQDTENKDDTAAPGEKDTAKADGENKAGDQPVTSGDIAKTQIKGMEAMAALMGAPPKVKKKKSPMAGLFGGQLDLGGVLKGSAGGSTPTTTAAKPDRPVAEPPPPTPTTTVNKPGGSPGGASCKAVVSHLMKVMTKEMAQVPAKQRAMIEPMIVEVCEKQFTPEARACILKSTTPATMQACEKQIQGSGDFGNDDDDDDDDGIGNMGYDVPTDKVVSTGDADCDAVGAAMAKFTMKQAGAAGQTAQAKQMAIMVQNQMSKTCVQANWPKPLKNCLKTIKDEKDIQACAMKMMSQ